MVAPELGIHDGGVIGGSTHFARADRVVDGEGHVTNVAAPVRVRVKALRRALCKKFRVGFQQNDVQVALLIYRTIP